jgi:hypothetical protein
VNLESWPGKANGGSFKCRGAMPGPGPSQQLEVSGTHKYLTSSLGQDKAWHPRPRPPGPLQTGIAPSCCVYPHPPTMLEKSRLCRALCPQASSREVSWGTGHTVSPANPAMCLE